ncbi:COL28A1 isoform 5, partial [Pan troglodytes]
KGNPGNAQKGEAGERGPGGIPGYKGDKQYSREDREVEHNNEKYVACLLPSPALLQQSSLTHHGTCSH